MTIDDLKRRLAILRGRETLIPIPEERIYRILREAESGNFFAADTLFHEELRTRRAIAASVHNDYLKLIDDMHNEAIRRHLEANKQAATPESAPTPAETRREPT